MLALRSPPGYFLLEGGSVRVACGVTEVLNMTEQDKTERVETLLATPDLAGALESEQFKRFLDQVPIAIAVSEMKEPERIVYANPEFEKVTGQLVAAFVGKPWTVLVGVDEKDRGAPSLGEALAESGDFVGTFTIERAG